MRFVHTADWQIGRPFAHIRDPHKRSLARQARVDAIERIGAVARDGGAAFVLVAGDLFDSPSADKATVSAACSAIGKVGLPVLAIPGNHDHAGPGTLWDQEFFRREQAQLAPNLAVLLKTGPYELDQAVILPCPLMRRSGAVDTTEWLRSSQAYEGLPQSKPRIVLAHGSTQVFTGEVDGEDGGGYLSSVIELEQLPDAEIDYVALGDWHGTRQVGSKAWYSGTPEPDRFPKGGEYDTGNILMVEVERGCAPAVSRIHTGRLTWTELSFDLTDDSALPGLERRLSSLLGQRANEDLLHLHLTGSLGIEASNRLDSIYESLEARLLRVKLDDRIFLAPTRGEIEDLTRGGADPLIARVAAQLVERAAGSDEDAVIAHLALRELHAVCEQERAG